MPEIDWKLIIPFQPQSIQQNFLETINNIGIFQVVNGPIRGDNILDLIFCSIKSCIPILKIVAPFSTSDHNSIYFEILNSNRYDGSIAEPKYRDFQKGDYIAINFYLQSISWPDFFTNCANANDFFNKFLNLLN